MYVNNSNIYTYTHVCIQGLNKIMETSGNFNKFILIWFSDY